MNLISLLVSVIFKVRHAAGTIDINLSELKYLAAHLELPECRRLIAALHYTSYELPNSMEAAERKVVDDIPCLEHLLHWNSSPNEGRGETHDRLEHRLRQIGRNDLADWLGNTVFTKLAEDLDNALNAPFAPDKIETQYPSTRQPINEPEEDSWTPVDYSLLATLAALGVCLLGLVLAVAVEKIKSYIFSRKANKLREQKMERKRRQCDCENSGDSETGLLSSSEEK